MAAPEMLRCECAWCGVDLGEKPAGGAPGGVSHGICRPCLVEWNADAQAELHGAAGEAA